MSSPPKPPDSPLDSPPPAGKKPYQKPQFQYERVFETMALACGKANPVIQQCALVRKNS